MQANWNFSYNKVTRTNSDDRLITGGKIAETADGDEVFYWIGQPPQEMFSTERFADGSLTYVISGMQAETADYYTGKQDIHAGYLMGEFSFLRKLHLTTGARLEKTKTEVTTELYNLGTNAISDSLVTLEKTDWLPADNSMDKDVDHTINKIKEGAKQSAGTTVVYLDRKNAPPRLFSISQKGEETLLKSYGEENSANAATLARVIRETKELLPSDQFGLVFWTHSMGWYPATYIPEASVRYVGIDETPADRGSSMSVMEIDEIAEALPDRVAEYIWFDVCLMGSVEALYAFRNKAAYLVGSPTEVLLAADYDASGAPYAKILPSLFGGKEDLPRACKLFYDHYNGMKYEILRSASIALMDAGQLNGFYATRCHAGRICRF